MKRLILLISIFSVLLSGTACAVVTRQGKVLNSIGRYESKQFWTHGEFQDYTDFGIYTYSSIKIDNNQYFRAVSEADIEEILSFIDNFEKWVDTIGKNMPDDELVTNYSFDSSIIDTNDYFYIYEGENYSKFGCYDIWFADMQTNTLYYFHNNI